MRSARLRGVSPPVVVRLRGARLRGARGVSGSGGADDVTRLREFPNDGSSPIVSWNCCTRSTISSSFSINSSICDQIYIYIRKFFLIRFLFVSCFMEPKNRMPFILLRISKVRCHKCKSKTPGSLLGAT